MKKSAVIAVFFEERLDLWSALTIGTLAVP